MTAPHRLSFNELLEKLVSMREEQVEVALTRPAGPTRLALLRGRLGRPTLGRGDDEGLAYFPVSAEPGTGLYLKAQDFTEAVDHGDLGLVVMSGGLQVSIELV